MELSEIVRNSFDAAVVRAREGGVDPRALTWILTAVGEFDGWVFLQEELDRRVLVQCHERNLRADESIRAAFVAAQLVRGVLHAGPLDGLSRVKDVRHGNACGILDAVMEETSVTVSGLFVSRSAEAQTTAQLIARMIMLRVGGVWRVSHTEERVNSMACWLTPTGLSGPLMPLQQRVPYIIPFGV